MGRRSRRRAKQGEGAPAAPASTTDYSDEEDNILTLREELSAGTLSKLRDLDAKPAASAEDRSQRRVEFLFERLAVRWEIAGLPLTDQATLLARYRMADAATQAWVRQTIDGHLERHIPELR